MPTILRIGAYRFFFVSSDREEPPHVHVRRENMVAKFWLKPLALERTGGFGRVELKLVARIVRQNREGFLRSWYEFFGR